ncbi:MAG: adenylyltransferase/cytidyltransferase family protein [Myxococcota bacterium]|jgi:rfaE bifunctional protein nucleotidyltransferase chain/domain
MPGRYLELDELAPVIASLKGAGRTVVLCNGVFDLLHVGHLRYLRAAKALGDVLVVAINGDMSTRRLKGAGRPYMPAAERGELLCALDCVDFVTPFEDGGPSRVLRTLLPDIHAKGTDYTPEKLPEGDLDRELGIRIAITGDPKDHSTGALARKIREAKGG